MEASIDTNPHSAWLRRLRNVAITKLINAAELGQFERHIDRHPRPLARRRWLDYHATVTPLHSIQTRVQTVSQAAMHRRSNDHLDAALHRFGFMPFATG